MKELVKIQSELKAPKNQTGQGIRYKYRSAEDILEALKPLLKENNCFVLLSDQVSLIGDRYYIVATATIFNSEGKSVSVTGIAREEESKKMMDVSQLSGATSSYARKYALNGLFAIDDTKDNDALGKDKNKKEEEKKPIKADFIFDSISNKESVVKWILSEEEKCNTLGIEFNLVSKISQKYNIEGREADIEKLINLVNLSKA